MTPELKDLEAAILAYGHGEEDVRAWLAVDRIRARVLELEPLVAFGGGLGAVYAAEIQGLLFALNLLGEGE